MRREIRSISDGLVAACIMCGALAHAAQPPYATHAECDCLSPCVEAEGDLPRGSLRRYQMRWPEGRVLGWQTYARGLRNSMALPVHPESGLLLQGENGRDNIHRHIPGMEGD